MLTAIIPSRTGSLIAGLFRSILVSQPDWKEHIRLAIADDGVAEEDRTELLQDGLIFVPCPRKGEFNFGANVNTVARQFPDSNLFIMNDDSEVRTPRFLEIFTHILSDPKYKEFGVLSPRILRNVGNAEQSRSYQNVVYECKRPLCFVAVVIRRECFDQIGGMQEIYSGGQFEDDDFCIRARMKGWRLGVVSSVHFDHSFHQTYDAVYGKEKADEFFRRNREIFERQFDPATLKKFKPHCV